MLDSRSLALLNVICKNTSTASYKVFSIEFMLSEIPKELGLDEEAILNGLNYLVERDYISVKYQDQSEACVMPTQKGRLVFENKRDQEEERKQKEKKYFVYSFLGSLIGSIIIWIVTILFWVAAK